MEKILYLFIQDKIKSLVKHYDWFNDQFNTEATELPFKTPAAFIEILPYQTQRLGNKRQSASIQFRLHVGQHLYENMREGSPRQSKALEHLDLINTVFNAVEGKNNGTTIGSIMRTNVAPDHRYKGYIIHIQTFNLRMFTDTASNTTRLPDTPKVPTNITEVNI